MIYLAAWPDGRRAVVRAHNEEAAKHRATEWRTDDSEREPNVPVGPTQLEQMTSRGPTGVLLAGWDGA